MEISQQALEEFKRIYEKEYGGKISDGKALKMAQRVLLSIFIFGGLCG